MLGGFSVSLGTGRNEETRCGKPFLQFPPLHDSSIVDPGQRGCVSTKLAAFHAVFPRFIRVSLCQWERFVLSNFVPSYIALRSFTSCSSLFPIPICSSYHSHHKLTLTRSLFIYSSHSFHLSIFLIISFLCALVLSAHVSVCLYVYSSYYIYSLLEVSSM